MTDDLAAQVAIMRRTMNAAAKYLEQTLKLLELGDTEAVNVEIRATRQALVDLLASDTIGQDVWAVVEKAEWMERRWQEDSANIDSSDWGELRAALDRLREQGLL